MLVLMVITNQTRPNQGWGFADAGQMSFAEPGMPETVDSPVADIDTFAVNAGPTTMHWNMNGKRVAPAVEPGRCSWKCEAKRPWYARIMFGYGEVGRMPTAMYTETALPVPNIPDYELTNEVVSGTIQMYPRLFAIVTPIRSTALR